MQLATRLGGLGERSGQKNLASGECVGKEWGFEIERGIPDAGFEPKD